MGKLFRILHIEDEVLVQQVVKQIIGDSFDLFSVSSIAQAYEAIKNHTFDLLLIDLNILDSNGLDTILNLKATNLPLIVLTVTDDPEIVQKAAELGVEDYIVKHDLGRAGIVGKISFTCEKFRKKNAGLNFGNFSAIKPYLKCQFDRIFKF